MTHETGHIINAVTDGSIAEELGIVPGDRLLALDGSPVIDVFDYRTRQLKSQVVLTIDKPNDGLFEFDIEKDDDEDLGLDFENPVMTDCDGCQNHCVFCFIDQLPKGLRPSLYFKDDDMRLSFLTGNYVTLTNIGDDELERLISYRFSPVNLSVHTTDPTLRMKMMRHRDAGDILARMRRIAAAGLVMNAQIVLCPGLNDGEALERTLNDLIDLGPALQSIAIVPVGLTRYRQENQLFALRSLEKEDAVRILEQVFARQQQMINARGTRLVYAADEIYIKAEVDFPGAEAYEDFPQLENGVGMVSLLRQELTDGLTMESIMPVLPSRSAGPASLNDWSTVKSAIAVTGTAAEPLLRPWVPQIASRFGLDLRLIAVNNRFFGDTITVAGLLTGQDILTQISEYLKLHPEIDPDATVLVLPDCLLKSGEDVLLDDYSLQDISTGLSLPVLACPANANGLLGLMQWLTERSDKR